jgi:hypothetical protein
MRMNIDIDDTLLSEAMAATGLETKKATVEEACAASFSVIAAKSPSPIWPGWAGKATCQLCGTVANLILAGDCRRRFGLDRPRVV